MKLKFKAKIGYECWKKSISFRSHVLNAILTSIKEKVFLASNKLQGLLI